MSSDPARRSDPQRRAVLRGGAALGITSLVLPRSAAAASALASTTYTTVAEGGVVYGWGRYPSAPALGTGVTADQPTPRVLTGGSAEYDAAEFVKALPGSYVSIALAADGSIFSWGRGSDGALGSGGTSDRSGPARIATWTSDGSSVVTTPTIVDFGTCQRSVVALADHGEIYAWGLQYVNEAGLPANSTVYNAPRVVTATLGLSATVGTSDRIVQVAAGRFLSIWLDAAGVVRTAGGQVDSFTDGLLGQNQAPPYYSVTATPIGGDLAGTEGTANRIVQVAVGQHFGFALGRDGTMYGWGQNGSGQLGLDDTSRRRVPVALSGGDLPSASLPERRIVQVSCGNRHTLALGLDGGVYAWGAAGDGRLGNGTVTPNVNLPVEITGSGDLPGAGGADRIVQVVAGYSASYALGADGSVYAWGDGANYNLGNNATDDVTRPVRIWDRGAFADLAPYDNATSTRIVYLGAARSTSSEDRHVLAIDDSSLA